jgi:hypothetical protein
MENGITKRAFIIGILISILVAFYDHLSTDYLGASYLAIDNMPVAGIVIFFMLAFPVNAILKRIKETLAFNSGELLVIFIMLLAACSVTEMGFGDQILPILAGAYYYASSTNGWTKTILPHLKKSLVVHNPAAVRYFFEGLPPGKSIPWGVWLKPLSLWIPFILVLYFCMICIIVIFRKQWIEKENLIYPLTQLPLEMVKTEKTNKKFYLYPFFKNPLMWFGFIISFFFGTMIAFHNYFPIIPLISLSKSIPVFRNTSTLNFAISFPIIGFMYFASTEITLSLWFFNLIFQGIQGLLNITGISSTENIGIYGVAGNAYFAHIGTGAMIALVIYWLYHSKAHLKDVFRSATGKEKIDDSKEILSYKTSFWGLIIGSLFIILWLIYSGMTWYVGILFYIFAIMIFFVLTRIICESGIPTLVAPIISSSLVVSMLGSKNILPVALVALGLTYVYSADLRTSPMMATGTSLKIVENIKRNKRPIFWAIFLALIANIIATLGFVLYLAYKHGGLNLNGWYFMGDPQAPFTYVSDLIKNPTSTTPIRWVLTAGGLIFTGLLIFMHDMFLWWPLNPIGFAIAPVWLMNQLWFSIFIAWLIKKLILRYGGAKIYEKSKYFFLGLPLGFYTCAGIWVIIDLITGHHGNVIFWA